MSDRRFEGDRDPPRNATERCRAGHGDMTEGDWLATHQPSTRKATYPLHSLRVPALAVRLPPRRDFCLLLVLGRWNTIAHLCEVMLTVLVHPHGALSPGPFRPLIQLLPRLLLSFLFYLLASSLPTATAQDAGNRQLYRGLSTLAAPSPNACVNPFNLGSISSVGHQTHSFYLVCSMPVVL